jgi:hypothetical protein
MMQGAICGAAASSSSHHAAGDTATAGTGIGMAVLFLTVRVIEQSHAIWKLNKVSDGADAVSRWLDAV